ncbi:hypothetical protein BSL78_17183 [Apostichopus japonicus]|uniref:Reverse transcriptase domain-containing protein n=1 Tax=Stichopus japonicus TaxID=307972 RepID=A0A2G8KDD5_STIJA|nr:hypothetical protein BSL78_17183 [Apostichopus japonicus]
MLLGMNVHKELSPEVLVNKLMISKEKLLVDTPLTKVIQCLVRVAGRNKVRIAARSIMAVEVTCPVVPTWKEVILEPVKELPKGVSVGATLAFAPTGKSCLQVLNLTDEEVWLRPRTPLGKLQGVSWVEDATVVFEGCEAKFEEVQEHVRKLLAKGVIKPSTSPYASPVVLVRKTDGTLRLCVDYRKLNGKTRKDAYPLPRIQESLDALTYANWFSTIDLISGYHQVEMAEEDAQRTAFITPFGLYQYVRMPFGLCNAPGTFQRLMQACLGDQYFQSLLCYLDDILVYSSTFEDHLERLNLVFQRLRQHGLKIKPSKCEFFRPEVRYLGHRVTREGVMPQQDNIEAVKTWPVPYSVKELRSFIGFCSFYRRFVPGFSKIAGPLHTLVATTSHDQKNKKSSTRRLAWTTEHQVAFETLKSKLCVQPILGYADFTKPFELEVDASHQGLGAVLFQHQNGMRKVISYASRTLRGAERNMESYSSMKLEMLGLKWAVTEKFREYLLGNTFTIFTDNNPLAHLKPPPEGHLTGSSTFTQLVGLTTIAMDLVQTKVMSNGVETATKPEQGDTLKSSLPLFPAYTQENLRELQSKDAALKRYKHIIL